jgi:hypothetical protein
MTEFRSKGKGKDRKVYPIQKKKPFGIPRKLAYEEVMALRKEGKKARLIKTNQRLDLYAPYEGILPDGTDATLSPGTIPENRKFSSYEEIERVLGMTTSDAQAWADVHPDRLKGKLREEVEMFNGISTENSKAGSGKVSSDNGVKIRELLGIDNSRGKLNLNSDDLKMFYGQGSGIKIITENGKLSLLSIDPAHVAMFQETMETDLPNGYLNPVSYGKDFKTQWIDSAPADSERVRYPTVDYSRDSWTVRLEGEQLRTFLSALQKSREDTVKFRLDGDSQKASVQILTQIPDNESVKPKEVPIESVNAISSRPKLENKPTGWDNSESVVFATEYLRSTVRTMLGRKEFQNPKMAVLTMRLKQEYPIEMETRRLGPKGEHIEVKGIIAPRME